MPYSLCFHSVQNSIFSRLLFRNITHSLMELSLSREAANCAATRELPSILWNPKVRYRVHKSPPLVPILSQFDPIHTTPTYLFKVHFNIFAHLHFGLPSCLFPSGFPTNILCIHIFQPSCYIPCPSHPPWLDYSNYIWRRENLQRNNRYFLPKNHMKQIRVHRHCWQNPEAFSVEAYYSLFIGKLSYRFFFKGLVRCPTCVRT
jgi:hypothetical protein